MSARTFLAISFACALILPVVVLAANGADASANATGGDDARTAGNHDVARAFVDGPATTGGAEDAGSAALDAEHGSHVVARVRVDRTSGSATGIFGVEDAHGALVMLAHVAGGALYVSDGEENGAWRAPIQLDASVGSGWRRFDVLLHGDTYTLHANQALSVTARTFAHATRGAPVADPHAALGVPWSGATVQVDRVRVDDDGMARDTTFTRSLAESGFGSFENGDYARLHVAPHLQAHQSAGLLEVRPDLSGGVAYVHAQRTPATHAYEAEGSFSPFDALFAPAGIAVVAGLAGPLDAPDVLWAVVVEKVGVDAWALAYRAPDGGLTRVSPATTSSMWRTVHVHVDEATDSIVVQVHGSPTWTFTGQDLGTAERVGTGDVFADPLHPLVNLGPVGVARFDDVALYGEASP